MTGSRAVIPQLLKGTTEKEGVKLPEQVTAPGTSGGSTGGGLGTRPVGPDSN